MPVDIETRGQRLDSSLWAADAGGLRLSIVVLVLLACDVSEDPSEVGDLVGGAIGSGAARVLPVACDPMLGRSDRASCVLEPDRQLVPLGAEP